MPHLAKLLESGNNPTKVMQRRNSKSADYTRYFSLVESRKPVDRLVQQSAKDFVALHTQLIEELPTFIEGYMRIFDLVIVGFARAQARYHQGVQEGLKRYISDHFNGSSLLAGTSAAAHGVAGDSAAEVVRAWKEAWSPHADAMDQLESTRPGEQCVCFKQRRDVGTETDDVLQPATSRIASPRSKHVQVHILAKTATTADQTRLVRIRLAFGMSVKMQRLLDRPVLHLLHRLSRLVRGVHPYLDRVPRLRVHP